MSFTYPLTHKTSGTASYEGIVEDLLHLINSQALHILVGPKV